MRSWMPLTNDVLVISDIVQNNDYVRLWENVDNNYMLWPDSVIHIQPYK